MTIAEIESTLRTLYIRHPNLNVELLITLLTSGGWEDKVIKEAVSLFTSDTKKYQPLIQANKEIVNQLAPSPAPKVVSPSSDSTVAKAVPLTPPVASEIVYYKDGEEEEKIVPILPQNDGTVERKVVMPLHQKESIVVPQVIKKEVPQDITLDQKVEVLKQENHPIERVVIPVQPKVFIPAEKEAYIEKKEKKEEPQSLIVPKKQEESSIKKVDPPENLPLKPFESAPHVWPFSKYKEVFHGDVMPVLAPEERILVKENTKKEEVSPVVKKIKIKRTGFDGEDEGLIFLTGTTLLIILLLLAYMYSNGRL